MRSLFRLSIALTVALMLAAPTIADTWDETTNGGGDAGDFPTGGFQSTTINMPLYDTITGVLGDVDVDAYLITITSPVWSAEVVAGTETDTRLWLFDTAGNLLMANDDSSQIGGGLQSLISDTASFQALGDDGNLVDNPIDPTPGQDYVLVINGFGDDALDTGGANLTQINSNFSSLVGVDPASTGTFGSWEGAAQGGGTYEIALSGAWLASIPEPSTVGLLALGLVGCVTRRRRK